MRFLSKVRGWGRKGDADSNDSIDGEMAFEGAYAQPGAVAFQSAGEAALAEAKRTSKFDSMPPAHADSTHSIISESLPTEAADFAESRQLDDEIGRGALP